MKVHDKLVRDLIPAIILESGATPRWRYTASREQLLKYVYEKMSEELNELESAKTRTEQIEEAGDVYEVFLSLIRAYDISLDDVTAAADKKRMSRGGFREGIILKSVE